MSLTISPSPFGSLVVSVAETGSTLSVTTVATSPCVLAMALGVPGPQGEAGEPGANGQNGVGVPVGGTAGQVLAKIDGTNYNTEWVDAGAAGDYLPLAGGTMTGDITFSVDGNGNDSLLGAFGFGVENTNGQVAYIQPDIFRIYDNDHLTGTSVSGEGITFNDSTVQTTAGLPLTGGTVTGAVTFDGENGAGITVNNYAEITTHISEGIEIVAENLTAPEFKRTYIYPTYFQIYDVNSAEETQTFTVNISGIEKTGVAAFSLLADFGLTMDNGISFTPTTGLTLKPDSGSKITFQDLSEQTTAFPGYSGTSAQYIDGTGALQTFPTVTTAGKMVTTVRNNSGATITKGTVVYINGAVGNKPTIAKAQANSEATSKATFAFVEADIANNADGNVVQIGLLENIDTQGFSDGTQIFLSPTTAGAWTSTQPFSPYHYVRLGTVIRGGHPTQGSISVNIINGFQLDEMSDVGAIAPTNNNVLTWVSASSQWLDRSIPTILGYTPANGTNYLAKADNLSGLASTSTARTNLGLGTMAVATATDYLTKAGNLSGLASTSTARTNLGLGAVSTDAYATTDQAQAGTSTTTVISPSTFFDARWFSGSKSMVQVAWSTAVSGTGASAGAQNSNARLNSAPTTATGYAIASAVIANNSRGTIFNSGFDFSKRVAIGLRVARNVASPDSASVWRFSIGKASATDASDLSMRGLQVKVAGSGALQLLVHNGTTLTTTTSSFTPANGVSYDIVVTSDGAGACVLYVNGSSVATSSGGPTTAGATNADYMMFEVQNTSTLTGSPQSICISDYFVQVNS